MTVGWLFRLDCVTVVFEGVLESKPTSVIGGFCGKARRGLWQALLSLVNGRVQFLELVACLIFVLE